MTEVEEAVPLAKSMVTKSPDKKSVSKAGASLVFFAAFAVFIAARFSAKWVIPRGKRYAVATALDPRVGAVAASPQMEQQHNKDGILVQPLAQIQLAEGVTSKTKKHDDSMASMLAPGTRFPNGQSCV